MEKISFLNLTIEEKNNFIDNLLIKASNEEMTGTTAIRHNLIYIMVDFLKAVRDNDMVSNPYQNLSSNSIFVHEFDPDIKNKVACDILEYVIEYSNILNDETSYITKTPDGVEVHIEPSSNFIFSADALKEIIPELAKNVRLLFDDLDIYFPEFIEFIDDTRICLCVEYSDSIINLSRKGI